jgi:hypothetical protein
MAEQDPPKETAGSNDGNTLSLAQALLAPLNSIFEAQVHASRAFLNFFLQMGFRHQYTPDDLEALNANKEDPENKKALAELRKETEAKDRMVELAQQLKDLNLKDKATLTDAEKTDISNKEVELRDLKMRFGSLYQMPIEYVDQNGIERTIFIPNLALLPFQPLSIKSANFKYELKVKQASRTESQIKTAEGAIRRRPWFLIDPKKIEGEFAPMRKEGESSSDSAIKIEVTVGTVDVPYGLHKLISSMTSIAHDSASPPQSNIIANN